MLALEIGQIFYYFSAGAEPLAYASLTTFVKRKPAPQRFVSPIPTNSNDLSQLL
jgi:hypothetical protein